MIVNQRTQISISLCLREGDAGRRMTFGPARRYLTLLFCP